VAQKLATINGTLGTLVTEEAGLGDGASTELRVNAYGALYVAQVDASGAVVPQVATELTLLASAARTATVNTEVTNTPAYRGVIVVIDTTVDPAAASITPHIEGYSTLGDDWYTMLTGAAIADVGVITLRVYPGAVAAANTVADDWLPPTWRFRMAVADTDSITYSANAILLP
jgi:hypothetical protein